MQILVTQIHHLPPALTSFHMQFSLQSSFLQLPPYGYSQQFSPFLLLSYALAKALTYLFQLSIFSMTTTE